MKVAIVRGSNMNPFEMQSYEPLASGYDLTGFASYINNYDIKRIRFPVKKLHIMEEYYERLPWPGKSLAYGMLLPYGGNYRMIGLEKELASMDILHAAETYNGYSYQAARVKTGMKKKLVLTVWENVPFLTLHRFRGGLSNEKVVSYVRDNTDIFIAVTERAKNALIIEGVNEERIRVVPAGIDTDRFTPGPADEGLLKTLGISGDDFTILFVGRLTREKGIYDMLYAARLVSRDPDLSKVKFLIAGDGPEKSAMNAAIKKLGIEDRVKLAGNFTYDEIPGLYRIAKAFLLPSIPVHWWQEQFGMVLVEAMASGLPVISTMSGSIPEVVGDAGQLIQPADPVSIYDAVRELSKDEAYCKSLAMKARKRAVEQFGLDRVSALLRSAYSELQ
ncbi:glycosyltransferase [Methanocella arvoryzae]|nr:glycosyltransferase [Methanocella arvoryzae]